ncbi:MAG TPA: hypothetical protein VEF04_00470, partial [Blastocatellia bacterium]|nr:hypothetical protein [Blastocatellia bacterium]
MQLFESIKAGWQAKASWVLVVMLGTLSLIYSTAQISTLQKSQFWQSLCLVFFVIIVGRLAVRLPNSSLVVTPADACIFLAVFFLGTPAAVIISGLSSLISASRAKLNKDARIYFASGQALCTFLSSSLLYGLINRYQHQIGQPDLLHLQKSSIPSEVILTAGLAMIGAYFIVNAGLIALFQWCTRNSDEQASQSFWVGYLLWNLTHVFTCGLGTTVIFVLLSRYNA